MHSQFTPADVARFWSKVDKLGECWVWTASLLNNANGYGQFFVKNNKRTRLITAHRFAWMATHGEIPEGLSVLHECDNPPCVRPDHLKLGTQKQNLHDASVRGRLQTGDNSPSRRLPERIRRGQTHPMAKLTESDVLAIRSEYALSHAHPKELARRYGVDRSNIEMIISRKTWRHL